MSAMEVIIDTTVHAGLSAAQLAEQALAGKEAIPAANGALAVTTGKRTGRSPKDRFIVRDTLTETTVDWGAVNQPISPAVFDSLWQKAVNVLNQQEQVFVSWLQVGADPVHSLVVKTVTALAWHALFVHHLFVRPDGLDVTGDQSGQWTLLSVPFFHPAGPEDGVHSDAAILLDFSRRAVLVAGTFYAGEMKKAMFTVMNFLMPEKGILPMHCAANVGSDQKVALFFGLSGTGKTTLSADPGRALVGDDEHGWSSEGIFNFEGGCYAKCVDLSREREPVIWDAICDGAVMENVILKPDGQPDYRDVSLTENTRAAYPLEHVQQRVASGRTGLPNAVIFLTCDLHGVLPPVARLTREQAAWYFLSGYTALLGSTETGAGKGICETFSTCFGAPFFPRPPHVYAALLLQHLDHSGAAVWLVNTGWTGGRMGEGGERFSIPVTRAIVRSITEGKLVGTAGQTLPGFGLAMPLHVPGVTDDLLDPRVAWGDTAAWQQAANGLIARFIENFSRFEGVGESVLAAGPKKIT